MVGAVAVAISSPSAGKGTSTGIVDTLPPKKPEQIHSHGSVNVIKYHFPAPTSGKMMLNELHFARDHNIPITPNSVCKSALNKIGYEGYGSPISDKTVINPSDVYNQGKSVSTLPSQIF